MTVWTDLRHGMRMAAKNPAFTLAAVAALALGIAANMLVFTLINGALLRELPFDEPDRIVEISVFNRDNARSPTRAPPTSTCSTGARWRARSTASPPPTSRR